MDINGSIIVVKDVILVLLGGAITVYIPRYFNKREKRDDEMWKRINTHGHTVECDNRNCKPKIGKVIITEE